ncbi:MAG: right-handed parallel beta-helix repeat-containing protein [Planctomycetia bacterium]|nr:right-handed parallel beta-helix repeat-containing protein [Planctomycetia bacterium]
MRSRRTSRVPACLNSSVRLHGEPLERRCLLAGAPFVESTTPALNGNPSIVAGITSIKVVFSETVTGGAVSSNYDLRAAGADSLFNTSDDVLYPTTPTYSGRTATVKFDRIPVGAYRLTAYDTIVDLQGEMLDGDGNGTAGGVYVRTFSIIPGAASKLALDGIPSVADAGQQYGLTVTALDAYNNVATGYAGTVQITSKDAAAILPPNFSFTTANAGVATLPVTLVTGDTGVWVKATDTAGGFNKSLTGITVVAHGLTGFSATGTAPISTAGATQTVTIGALDVGGGVFQSYVGTVSVTTSDPFGGVPGSVTMTSADAGSKQISVTLKTAGPQTLTFTDIASGVFTTVRAGTVVHADLAAFKVEGFTSPTIAGDAHPLSVSALDVYGNVVLNYVGTIAFTSGDTNAILPAPYTFTPVDAGAKEFTAVLRNTAQNRAIVVTDTTTGATGKQSNIVVLAAFVSYSATSNIIYIDGDTATLSDIKYLVPSAPLALVDAGAAIWKLDANIRIINGGALLLHGTAIGGDVNQLRLRSENTLATNAIVEIRGDYGTVDIRSTYVTSWNNAVNGPDTEYDFFGRAYIRVRSSLAADGVTPLESRMDIVDSEIGYLGSHNSEAYGLSWKVIGEAGPNYELYDVVNVYGDILNNYIHHNYFGVFTYGHQGGLWDGNELAYNVAYGFDPHDDSDYLTITNNYVHDNGTHGIIGSKRCDHITIAGNISNNNGGNGIMLHRSTDYALIEDNITLGNADTGIAIFDSRYNVIRNNTARFNLHGIRFTVGAAENLIENNVFSDNLDQGIRFFQGSDPPSPGDDGRPKLNVFTGNTIANNGGYAVRARESDANTFAGNTILNNGEGNTVLFEWARNNVFRDNAVSLDTKLKVRGLSTASTPLAVSGQDAVLLDLDQYSIVTFSDALGAIYSLFDEDGEAASGDINTVTSTGSTFVVTSALTGLEAEALVERVPLHVAVSGGTATVEPVNAASSFKVMASSASVTLTLVFDELAAAGTYELSRNGTTVASGAANGAGTLTMSTTPGTTATVLYELEAVGQQLRAAGGTSSNPVVAARDQAFADLESSGATVFSALPTTRGRRRLIDTIRL